MNVKFHFPGPVKDMQPRKTAPEIIDINDHNEIVSALVKVLEKAVEDYGKPGGPWNVPSEPGTWLAMAQAALAKARGEEVNFNQTNNNQGDVLNIQDAKDINSDVKWGQYHNDFILLSENMYALVQISKSGQVCSMIGRRSSAKRVFLEDYHRAKWFDGVEEARKWAEKQLFPEAKNEG